MISNIINNIVSFLVGKKIEKALKECQGADIATMSYPDPSDYEEK
jgi:hypothetical protein